MQKRSSGAPLIRAVGGTVAAAALVVGVVGNANASEVRPYAEQAGAAGVTGEQAAALQADIDRRLAEIPRATQTGFNRISFPEGVTRTFDVPGAPQATGTPNCGAGSFCMYRDADYEPPSGHGGTISFWKCGSYDLNNPDYDFLDKATSLHNNQTQGTYAWAGSSSGSGWDHVYYGPAPYSAPHLGGGSDTADHVWLCNP